MSHEKKKKQYGKCLGKYYNAEVLSGWNNGLQYAKMGILGQSTYKETIEKEDCTFVQWFPINCHVNYMNMIFDKE